ncbi:MAG: hypothetical protein AMDU4_FER2C00182G0005 [Ferroplasma sp. Type II]|jgi:CRISPR/Cas system-associated endonuclease Cas1|nr:MAG: hypothetical protein AMDU4_FER2C00182G0005 [Ferroplasma sp. Type II]
MNVSDPINASLNYGYVVVRLDINALGFDIP